MCDVLVNCVKHILLHTLQLFIIILLYFLQIIKTGRMKVSSFESSKFIIFFKVYGTICLCRGNEESECECFSEWCEVYFM